MKNLNVKEKMMCEEVVKKSLIWLENADLKAKKEYCENYLSDFIYDYISAEEFSEDFIKHCINVSIEIYKQSYKILHEQIYSL